MERREREKRKEWERGGRVEQRQTSSMGSNLQTTSGHALLHPIVILYLSDYIIPNNVLH